jgi:DNA replication licensing factor MCM5
MSAFEADHVYAVQARNPPHSNFDGPVNSETEKQLLDFLLHYRVDNDFVYRSVLKKHITFLLHPSS